MNMAALFFKETWHTPSVPMEDAVAVLWEGIDGSQLLTAPRNKLNVRQWPEEFRRLHRTSCQRTTAAERNGPANSPVAGITALA